MARKYSDLRAKMDPDRRARVDARVQAETASMTTMEYPVHLERDDNDMVLVRFPDFPEAHTFGTDEADALAHAADALATVIEAYIKDRRDIPRPSPRRTRWRVALPPLVEANVRLYETTRVSEPDDAAGGR